MQKPWGFEHLLYKNKNVGIWYLFINHKSITSFHAHPNKKTALLVLSGTAKVSFMNGCHELQANDKIIIRNGVFHKTQALNSDLELIEMEQPDDKLDIIRLEDNYERAGLKYEDSSHYLPGTKHILKDVTKIGACVLTKLTLNHADLLNRQPAKIMILDGMIYFKEYCVLGPGDVVDNVTLHRMAEKFPSVPMEVLEAKLAENFLTIQ